METIIKTGYFKIIGLFYADKHARFHLREIARKARLNENSATRFLAMLEKEKVLFSEKDGNLKKYSIMKNKKAFFLFSLFDIQRQERLPEKRKNAIKHFLDYLREKPLIVVLFGSTAKGNFTDKSDIDLLLIVNKKIETGDAEDYADSQTGIRVGCIQIKYGDFKNEIKIKQDKVIQSALNSGFPVLNHLNFYEAYYESL